MQKKQAGIQPNKVKVRWNVGIFNFGLILIYHWDSKVERQQ